MVFIINLSILLMMEGLLPRHNSKNLNRTRNLCLIMMTTLRCTIMLMMKEKKSREHPMTDRVLLMMGHSLLRWNNPLEIIWKEMAIPIKKVSYSLLSSLNLIIMKILKEGSRAQNLKKESTINYWFQPSNLKTIRSNINSKSIWLTKLSLTSLVLKIIIY